MPQTISGTTSSPAIASLHSTLLSAAIVVLLYASHHPSHSYCSFSSSYFSSLHYYLYLSTTFIEPASTSLRKLARRNHHIAPTPPAMPTESALPTEADPNASRHPLPASLPLKCSVCGLGALGNGVRTTEDASLPFDPVCSICVGSQELRRNRDANILGLGIDVEESETRGRRRRNDMEVLEQAETADPREDDTDRHIIEPVPIPRQPVTSPSMLHSHSLPSQPTRPWTTSSTTIRHPIPESPASPDSTRSEDQEEVNAPPNPLLDVSRSRMPSMGRGALYPGSVFKGTQTSGRSAYEVEVRILVRENGMPHAA